MFFSKNSTPAAGVGEGGGAADAPAVIATVARIARNVPAQRLHPWGCQVRVTEATGLRGERERGMRISAIAGEQAGRVPMPAGSASHYTRSPAGVHGQFRGRPRPRVRTSVSGSPTVELSGVRASWAGC